MALTSDFYNHPTYITRQGVALGEAGGAATTQYAKYVAFTDTLAYSAVLHVTTAGTNANALCYVSQISGGNVTVLGTATTGTSVAGTVIQVALSSVAGGVTLAKGDVLSLVTGVDANVKLAVSYEVSSVPGANITK